jgi:hypothetical protein
VTAAYHGVAPAKAASPPPRTRADLLAIFLNSCLEWFVPR